MRRPAVPLVVFIALAVVLGLALVVAASTTTAAFGAYNLEWDGTSDFRELADEQSDSRVILDTAPYGTTEPNGTVAIVLAPVDEYDTNASANVREFVAAGGTLVVADGGDPGSNALLADVGASARFDGDLLRDERNHYRGPNLTVVTNVSETEYTTGVSQLTFNRGTTVIPNGATTIATTSEFAYLDRNETGELSDDDELGERPAVTVESVGDGQVIAVGDASLFINSMLDQPDNEAFATALVTAHERNLLDYSHSGAQPPLVVALTLFRSSAVLQVALGLLGVLAVWTVGRRDSARGSRSVWDRVGRRLPTALTAQLPTWVFSKTAESPEASIDREAIMASLQRQYPELDEERLERLIGEVLSAEDEGGSNE